MFCKVKFRNFWLQVNPALNSKLKQNSKTGFVFSIYKSSKYNVYIEMAAKKILFQNILTYLQKNRPIQCRNFMYRTYDNLKQNNMVKVMGSAESRRYVLKKDGLGYSMHLTLIGKIHLQFSDLSHFV